MNINNDRGKESKQELEADMVQERPYFYQKLLDISDECQLKYEMSVLKPAVLEEQKANDEYWSKLVQLKTSDSDTIILRQDSNVSYNQCRYDENDLLSNEFDPLFYSTNSYLINLLINAYNLNDKFHGDMQDVMSRFDGKYSYKQGPIKALSRCIDKCSSDYKDSKFPQSARICDIIRCSIVFGNSKDLYLGINHVIDCIKNGSTKYCKKILRVKNTMATKKGEFRYGDIKANIFICDDVSKTGMIVEVQFLVEIMLKHKRQCHSLYSVSRRKEMFENICTIDHIMNSDKQQQLQFILCNMKDKANTIQERFSLLYFGFDEKIDLMQIHGGYNMIDLVVVNGNHKLISFLDDATKTKKWSKEQRKSLWDDWVC